MMKKLSILLAVLILVSGLVFAQEETQPEETRREIEIFNWEFSVAYPVHWSNGYHGSYSGYHQFYPGTPPTELFPDKTVTANTAIGTSMNFNFTKHFGLTLDFDFSYSTKLTGIATSQSDLVTMFGMNLFLGPQFYIVNSDRLRVPLAVGWHLYYFSDEVWMAELLHEDLGQWVNRTDLQMGPGVMFGVQFHFDNAIYLFSRTSVYIDLMRWHEVRGQLWSNPASYVTAKGSDIFDIVSWSIKPAIGIGIKF